MDIGNFSKQTILTGAGWTRNSGGRLRARLAKDAAPGRDHELAALEVGAHATVNLWTDVARS